MEDEDDEDAIKQSEGDFEDEDPEANLPDVFRSAFSRLSALKDELARRQ